jgi:hypothetical protein
VKTECLCCGSIGPQEICLCTVRCFSDDTCADVEGMPECNMREGAKSGICTAAGFNCCWDCQ